MAQTRFQMLNEVFKEEDKWRLCLQWGRCIYGNGKMELAYRFIWRDENGHLRAQRAQAFISSLKVAQELIDKAKKEGWGDYKGGYV